MKRDEERKGEREREREKERRRRGREGKWEPRNLGFNPP